MYQNTGSRVEAHLQLDNQQQVQFLCVLVHLTLRRHEDISNALNLSRGGRNCEIFVHIYNLCPHLQGMNLSELEFSSGYGECDVVLSNPCF